MRLSPTFAALFAASAVACSSSPTQSVDVAAQLTGTWTLNQPRGNQNNPDGSPSLVLDLTASGNTVTGTGLYSSLAQGPVTVTGTITGSVVELVITLPPGNAVHFRGTIVLGKILSGHTIDPGESFDLAFHKSD